MHGLIVSLALLAPASGQDELELPALFSDQLVLQRDTLAPFWGRAAPGARVELRASWDPRGYTTTAAADGRWRLELPTPGAGGPHELTLTSGALVSVLHDVLIGEVWLAAGQSNMQHTLGPLVGDGVEGWEDAARDAEDPELRFFGIENASAPAPLADVRAHWVGAGPESALRFSACAYFFARELRAELGVPVGVITAAWGGTPIEAWVRVEALRSFSEFDAELARLAARGPPPDPSTDSGPLDAGALWNGMIAPLVPCALRGVIWYQGEASRMRADLYRRLFPALIEDWRAAFGRPEMPFYFVQIAPFAYPGDQGQAGRLRDAQRRTLALPHTGMAVTMDIGDPLDPHPKKKREVGERLALWALAGIHGRAREHSGPLYCSMNVEESAIRLDFEHGEGLTSRGEPVRHVTLAGPDGVFHAADARIEGETLVVTSPEVRAPAAVRFGWGAADETNLWNAAGLPAACFRTDDWP